MSPGAGFTYFLCMMFTQMFMFMERAHGLDITNDMHIGALQALAKPVLQYRLDLLRADHNSVSAQPTTTLCSALDMLFLSPQGIVRRTVGRGRPSTLLRQYPHPG